MSHRHTSQEGENITLALEKGNNAEMASRHTTLTRSVPVTQMDTQERQLVRERAKECR